MYIIIISKEGGGEGEKERKRIVILRKVERKIQGFGKRIEICCNNIKIKRSLN